MVDGERIKKIFSEAIEVGPAEREAFIRMACGVDLALQKEIASLLQFYDRVEDFLDIPAVEVSADDLADNFLESETASAVGRVVGAYRIESEIGSGGMGSVYLATRADQVFTKHVAIKLLRRGTENESVVRRFEKERQVLADLEHPNIARLIDGGTTENGLPYFVMEYVAGRPIDQFCEERGLSANARLLLFRQVCSAVECAHEHSIIHRDLKPGNILVNEKAVPKLLDFGIAKSTRATLNADSTATAFRLMTPEYASPEQMRGDPVSEAADIYSLGVVLYQLITGRRPYDLDKKSPFQIVQAICEDVPPAPSSIPRSVEHAPSPAMSGELDKIVLKAIRKVPAHRYASVREFSDDIGRLLEGVPVKAQREPLRYRASKFYQKNRAAFLTGLAASLVVLMAVLSFSLWNRARVGNGAPAAPAAKDAKVVRVFPLDDPRRGGTANAEARELYLKAQSYWESRTATALVLAAKLFQDAVDKDPEFALAYSGLSNANFLLSVWGRVPVNEAFPRAREAALRAIALAPDMPEGHLSLAMVRWLYEYDWPAADAEFKRAIELDPAYARAPHWYALFLAEMGRFDEAEASARRAIDLEPDSVPTQADLARVLYYARRYDESLAQYRKVLAAYPTFLGFYHELSELYEATGKMDEYFALFEKFDGWDAEPRKAFNKGGMPGYRQFQARHAETTGLWAFYALAELYAQLGQHDRAFRFLEEAIGRRDHKIAQLKVNPKFDVLRADPRFIALLKRLRLDS